MSLIALITNNSVASYSRTQIPSYRTQIFITVQSVDPDMRQFNQSHILTVFFSKIHFNIILPSIPRCPQYSSWDKNILLTLSVQEQLPWDCFRNYYYYYYYYCKVFCSFNSSWSTPITKPSLAWNFFNIQIVYRLCCTLCLYIVCGWFCSASQLVHMHLYHCYVFFFCSMLGKGRKM
jgi:hypothetical protein